MNKFEVKWSTGKTTVYETEKSEFQFREGMFGHPERLPDGVTIKILGAENAIEVGEVEEGDLGEHQNRDGGGETAEASDRDCDVESRKEQAPEEVQEVSGDGFGA